MAEIVKKSGVAPVSQTRISSKHQVTIGRRAFQEAGFREGDVVAVRAVGPGRVELTTLEALFDTYRGRVKNGGNGPREAIDQMRDEWR